MKVMTQGTLAAVQVATARSTSRRFVADVRSRTNIKLSAGLVQAGCTFGSVYLPHSSSFGLAVRTTGPGKS